MINLLIILIKLNDMSLGHFLPWLCKDHIGVLLYEDFIKNLFGIYDR